jgi:hypothetical protein
VNSLVLCCNLINSSSSLSITIILCSIIIFFVIDL